jgi:ribonucleoside-diphosphate reductase alpha chain
LRRNTGDERRRTHDMNTANWIPDLFMKRMLADQEWTLFSPHEVPDLHGLYGAAFEERYVYYEQQAKEGKISLFKIVSAQKLWRKMLSRLFETGHPWITFKDPCNIRSPQDHVGVVHSSNLCTEITLNTSDDETAVCNLGSINISRYIEHGALNEELLRSSIFTAIRMLDNVIDLNFYPTKEARNSNMRHRPIGLGLMGFQDALYKLNINFNSDDAIRFADELGEKVLYYAVEASCLLAQERGAYLTYKGSKWDRGIFPLDTIELLEKERGRPIKGSRTARLDWSALKARVATYGMRNSNLLAVAPTATIANIAGCFPSIEPIYRNIYVKSNIAGEFTIINTYLVDELKELGLWDTQMLEEIKYYDGNLSMIKRIPQALKDKYKGAFEIDPLHLIKVTAARGKWIDQSQSYNVFMQGVSGQLMHDIYVTAWEYGMKTTLGASQIEKSTLDAKKYGFTQKRDYRSIEQEQVVEGALTEPACRIDNPECESCQ